MSALTFNDWPRHDRARQVAVVVVAAGGVAAVASRAVGVRGGAR